MEKVVIEVVGQTQGLDDVNAKLDSMQQREKQILREMESLKKAQSDFAGGGKVLERINAEYDKLDKELKSNRKSIEDLSASQKKMPGEMIAKNTEKSFRTLRREIEEQIKQMQRFGETGTEKYQELIKEAGRLADIQGDVSREINNLASDTYAFDTVLEGTQLIAGGFSVAQGAVALFGKEEEKLQQMMVKLQGAIAITTGLQQVQNAVQRESNIMRGVATIQTKAAAAAENIKTATTGKGIVATKAATVAQWLFNAAAKANPYLLLFTGLSLAVGALLLFIRNTESAAEAQKKLNEQEQIFLDKRERINERLKKEGTEKTTQIENELDLAKTQGKSIEEIRALEDKLAQQRQLNYKERDIQNSADVIALETNKDKLIQLEKQLDNVNQKKLQGDKTVNIDINLDGKLEKSKIDDAIEALQGQIDNTKQRVTIAVSLKEEGQALADEAAKRKAQREKEDAERTKRSEQALADYRVLMANKGSEEELKAQKKALKVKLKNDLDNANLSTIERLKLRAETQKAMEKLDEEYQKKQLQDAITVIDAQLAGEKELNLTTYNLRIARLEAQKKLNLANAKDNKAQQLLIEKEHQAALIKLDNDYEKEETARNTNSIQSNINARLAATKAGSKEEHDLRVESLNEIANAEIKNANLSISNEQERAAKIKEIRAKLKQDINDLDVEYMKSADERSKAETLAVTQQYEKGTISRYQYEKQLQDTSIKSLEEEIAERKSKGEETVELEKELSEKRIEIAEKEKEERMQLFQELYNLMSSVGNAFFDMQNQRLSQEMDDLNHYYTTDVEAAKKNNKLKLISEEELARQQLEIKRKQAQAEKEQAYFNATMQLAEGIVRIWSQKGVNPILAAALTAIMVATTSVQIAAIKSKPLPKYWKGRKGGKGEWALAGEYGPELMFIPDKAAIMPASDTRMALQGNENLFDKWNMPRLNPPISAMPFISQKIINQYQQKHRREERIDYDKLGRAVARHMKFPKQKAVAVHFDKSGLSIKENNTTTYYLNEKYTR